MGIGSQFDHEVLVVFQRVGELEGLPFPKVADARHSFALVAPRYPFRAGAGRFDELRAGWKGEDAHRDGARDARGSFQERSAG